MNVESAIEKDVEGTLPDSLSEPSRCRDRVTVVPSVLRDDRVGGTDG
jgi:hypothetical protein